MRSFEVSWLAAALGLLLLGVRCHRSRSGAVQFFQIPGLRLPGAFVERPLPAGGRSCVHDDYVAPQTAQQLRTRTHV